ncbi:MAG: PadR family transcriptional regulator [Austwickia sp.]|nr:PadR family transcriptional regulator [Actinomycetota bacterium]MCB1254007.1 PadR family transcriptional regulator [Austwickia sp.]MCO5309531.1 PadR family transcriptional regulator [Austwickia sp.]
MSAAHALLGLLEPAPAYGYTLKRQYDERFAHTKPLAYGQVYASLARFERQGWAEVVDVEAGDGPDRKRYRITGEGVTVLDAWVYEPQPPGVFAASTLFARVSVALMSDRDAGQVLDLQRASHLRRMRELTRARDGALPLEDMALTYELAHLDADLRWIEEAAARLAAVRAQPPRPATVQDAPRGAR